MYHPFKKFLFYCFIGAWITTAWLVAARITDLTDCSWWFVFAPFWIPSALLVVAGLIACIYCYTCLRGLARNLYD